MPDSGSISRQQDTPMAAADSAFVARSRRLERFFGEFQEELSRLSAERRRLFNMISSSHDKEAAERVRRSLIQ